MTAPYVDSRTQSRVNTAGNNHTAALPAQTAGGLLLTSSSFSGAEEVTPPAQSTGWRVLANEVYDAGLTPERRILMAQVRGNSAVGAPIFTSADATLSAHVSWQILGHTVSNPATDIIVGSSLAGAMPAVAPAFSIPVAKDCLVLAVGSASTPSGGVTGNTSNTGYTQFRTYSTTTTSAAGSQVWAAEFTPASGTSSVPAASFPSGLSATLGMHIAIPGTGPSTMLGAYGFNEGMGASAADSSGLTALGPMTPKASDMPTWPAGKTQTGVQMTATGDAFYAFGVDPVPNIFARPFTLMFWAGDYGSQSVFAVCYGRAAGASAWDNVQYLRWHPQFNTANAQFFGQDAWNDNQVVFTDGWAHLALTFDLTNGLRLYANGTLIRSVPYSSLVFPSSFAQGASRIGLVRGRIDDLRLFDSALTATQIQAYRDEGIGGAPSTNPGTLAATLPIAQAAITGQSSNPGTLNGTAPRVTAAIPDQSSNPGTLAATTPSVTAAVAGQSVNPGTVAAPTPAVTAAITGQSVNAGAMAASTPAVAAAIAGESVNPAVLAATTPRVTASVTDQSTNPGTLAATVPPVTAAVAGGSVNPGALSASVPATTAAVPGQSVNPGTLSAVTPPVTAQISDTSINSGAMNAALPRVTAQVDGQSVNGGSLSASAPRVTASLPGRSILTGVLAASTPLLAVVFSATGVRPFPARRRLLTTGPRGLVSAAARGLRANGPRGLKGDP